MADPTTFPEEYVREPLVYRRISGFAIAGLIAACCYAVIVLFACASGFYERAPVLLPLWLQAIAVLGFGLALAALVHIRHSEATVAGTKLAVLGLLVSLFFGLGYGAYYVATYFAIRQQAYNFTLRWFKKLEEGKINHAFLDTQAPANRQRINPEDEDAINARFPAAQSRMMVSTTPVDSFRNNELVRMLTQGGPETRTTPLGVKDWDYARGGYIVQRSYQVETEEGVFEVEIAVQGSESKTREYEGREWNVMMGGGTRIENAQLSERAREIAGLREQSNQFLEEWGNKLVAGRLGAAYLDTREPSERANLEGKFRQIRAMVPVSALGLGALHPLAGSEFLKWATSQDADELVRQVVWPGYVTQFQRQGILQTGRFRAADVDTKERLLTAVKAVFMPAQPAGARLVGLRPGLSSSFRTWKIDNGRLLLPHDCKLALAVSGQVLYSVDATITVESDPGPVLASRKPTWRIISIDLRQGEDRARAPLMPGQIAS